jgi:hypothetical protein
MVAALLELQTTGQRADYFFINEQIESTRIRGAKKPVVTTRRRQSQTPQSLNPSVVALP